MPHHPVIRQERETTKLRIVYDGSAKPSANDLSIDCLQPGPNFIPKLFDVLIKFRSHSVALTGNIEKAFLMIRIDENDRDMLRFLWFKDPHEPNSGLVQLRFTRLVFGLWPSPSILGATISHHLNKHREAYPKLVDAIEGSLYVDDLLTGEKNDDRAFQVYKNSKKLMSQGFNLRKWNSNSPTLLANIKEAEDQTAPVKASNPTAVTTVSEEDESYAKATTSSNSTMGEEIESYTKLLGIIWDSQSDKFTFDFSELITYISKLPINKRSLLKFTAKIFDPLGFLSPFVFRLKMMFQVLCTDKLLWDDSIQGDMLNTWNSIVSEIKLLNGIRILRCYFQERCTTTNIQLHAFSDASEKAYAAAVYLRLTHSDGQVETRLIASNTRVAPIKTQTRSATRIAWSSHSFTISGHDSTFPTSASESSCLLGRFKSRVVLDSKWKALETILETICAPSRGWNSSTDRQERMETLSRLSEPRWFTLAWNTRERTRKQTTLVEWTSVPTRNWRQVASRRRNYRNTRNSHVWNREEPARSRTHVNNASSKTRVSEDQSQRNYRMRRKPTCPCYAWQLMYCAS